MSTLEGHSRLTGIQDRIDLFTLSFVTTMAMVAGMPVLLVLDRFQGSIVVDTLRYILMMFYVAGLIVLVATLLLNPRPTS